MAAALKVRLIFCITGMCDFPFSANAPAPISASQKLQDFERNLNSS